MRAVGAGVLGQGRGGGGKTNKASSSLSLPRKRLTQDTILGLSHVKIYKIKSEKRERTRKPSRVKGTMEEPIIRITICSSSAFCRSSVSSSLLMSVYEVIIKGIFSAYIMAAGVE